MAYTNLIESILDRDFVSANEIFESRMVELQEKKLYEAKRMVQSEMNYSPATKRALETGTKRLLTPAERKGREIDPNIKPDPTGQHVTGVKHVESKKRKAPPNKKVTKVAAGFKSLAPKGSVSPRSLDIGSRYQRALDTARDLESRGSTGKVAKVKKLYRPYRASSTVATGIKTVGKGIGAGLSNIGQQFGAEE